MPTTVDLRPLLGWPVTQETEQLTLDGPGVRLLILPSLLVTNVISITENGIDLDPSTYEWSSTGRVRRLDGCCWTDRFRSINVMLTHGYSMLPPDLEAVLDAAAARQPMGSTMQIGHVRVAVNADGSPLSGIYVASELAVLERYRIPRRTY